MTRKLVATVSSIVVVLIAALAAPQAVARKGEPDIVKVQHILIAFKGTVEGKEIDRSRREAGRLAKQLMKRALDGEDFEALMKEYTDDRGAGTYTMANEGVDVPAGALARGDMVFSFGDVAFRLEVGEIDIANHHAALSPFGYHVIKRIE